MPTTKPKYYVSALRPVPVYMSSIYAHHCIYACPRTRVLLFLAIRKSMLLAIVASRSAKQTYADANLCRLCSIAHTSQLSKAYSVAWPGHNTGNASVGALCHLKTALGSEAGDDISSVDMRSQTRWKHCRGVCLKLGKAGASSPRNQRFSISAQLP